jgi:NADPH2:quinone reductase
VAQGAHVIAVARTRHHALLTALGAAACLDYSAQEVEGLATSIAGRKQDAASSVGVRGDLDQLLDLNLTLHGILVRPEQGRLEALGRLVSRGALRPVIDRVLPLQEAAQAHRRLESGHGPGKIVLVVREQTNDQLQRGTCSLLHDPADLA